MNQPPIRKISSLVVLLLLFFLSLPAPLTAFTQGEQVPLQGWFSGLGPDFSGNATHLGRFTGVINNNTLPPHAVWTAADGDTLTNITTSFVIDFSTPLAPNLFPYSQKIEFTGGTGRFQNASSYAEITGTINVVTFAYDGRINGALSRPNSN